MQPSGRAETRTQLILSQSAVFAADGTASVTFLNGTTATWNVKLMNTTTTSTTQTKCSVYRGDINAGNQIDYTNTGNGDTSPVDAIYRVGDKITVRWTGGTPGAIATFRLEGDVVQVGRRAY